MENIIRRRDKKVIDKGESTESTSVKGKQRGKLNE